MARNFRNGSLGMVNPMADEEVLISLRRSMRLNRARPRQALALNRVMRDQLCRSCDQTLLGKRDRAVIALGYDTLCGRSEIVRLSIEDLQFLRDGSAHILIPRAKNDPFGNGRLGYISSKTAQYIRAWLRSAKINDGHLFRPIIWGVIAERHLNPYTVNRIIKSAAARANLPQDVQNNLSGHSMRVGAAQDMMKAGFGLLPIMRAGGWKAANVVGRYVENANLANMIASARKELPTRPKA